MATVVEGLGHRLTALRAMQRGTLPLRSSTR